MEQRSDRDPLETVARVLRPRQAAAGFYNRISPWYDLLSELSERSLRNEALNLLGAQEGECVCELGYGTGHAIVSLAQSVGATGHVYGLDLSSQMHLKTKGRLEKLNLVDRTALEVGDLTSLPYGDHIFDAVLMSFTLELFDTPDIPIVLAECQRVLKRSGRLVLVTMYDEPAGPQRPRHSWITRLYLWGHEKFPGFIDCRPLPTDRVLQFFGWRIDQAIHKSTFGLPVVLLKASLQREDELRTVT